MTVEEIKEFIHIVTESGIAELEVQRGDNRVRIKRINGTSAAQEFMLAPAAPVSSVPPVQQSGAYAHEPSSIRDAKSEPEATLIKSPIVGTFYESASPGSPPFVKVGDRVQPGQVLCIIESMKLMNEIEAEVSGTIISQLVENGRPVEYGEALFAVRAD